jgi:uncharacterized membrane protein YcaP (DUF421 family)
VGTVDILTYIAQALVLFTAAIAATRLLGKSAIVQLTPFDLVAIVIIGTVIAEPLVRSTVSAAVAGAGLLVVLHVLFSRLALVGRLNSLLLGEPSVVVKHGRLVVENLRRNSLSVAQLLALLRSSGYPYLDDIEFALLEPIGQVSILPRGGARPVCPDDLGLPHGYRGLPLPVVLDGNLKPENLAETGRDEAWLRQELARLDVRDASQVLYAYVEHPDTLVVNLKDGTARRSRPAPGARGATGRGL